MLNVTSVKLWQADTVENMQEGSIRPHLMNGLVEIAKYVVKWRIFSYEEAKGERSEWIWIHDYGFVPFRHQTLFVDFLVKKGCACKTI